MSKTSGFTLIELMVVISIIGILSAVGMASFGTISKNGRDAKRQSDLKSIQSALEQYYADLGYYPVDSGDTGMSDALSRGKSFTSAVGSIESTPPRISKTYLNVLPRDSEATTPYVYKAFLDGNYQTTGDCDNTNSNKRCAFYCLYTKVENAVNICTDTNRAFHVGCSSVNPNPAQICVDNIPTDYNFAVTPP